MLEAHLVNNGEPQDRIVLQEKGGETLAEVNLNAVNGDTRFIYLSSALKHLMLIDFTIKENLPFEMWDAVERKARQMRLQNTKDSYFRLVGPDGNSSEPWSRRQVGSFVHFKGVYAHRAIKAHDNKLTWTENCPWEFEFDMIIAMAHNKEAVELTKDEFEKHWNNAKILENSI